MWIYAVVLNDPNVGELCQLLLLLVWEGAKQEVEVEMNCFYAYCCYPRGTRRVIVITSQDAAQCPSPGPPKSSS